MLKRRIGFGIAVALVLALVPSGPASATRTNVKTTIDVTYNYPDDLHGKVHSPKAACRHARHVRLIHIDGQTGARTVAGNATTRSNGSYSMNPSVTPTQGDDWLVKARVKNTMAFHCLAARKRIPA
jgi:hypothetical protein